MSDFAFSFKNGQFKRSGDMTREELLEVIDTLIGERNWWKNETKTAFAFGSSLLVRPPRQSPGDL